MIPVIRQLEKKVADWELEVCSTGQHREMLAEIFEFFAIQPDVELNVMREDQSLAMLSEILVKKFDQYLQSSRPDFVFVHGDTSTSFFAALCAFYAGIPVGHVEAGLRTHAKGSPFPEEFNRRAIAAVADLHFAPTQLAWDNLIREGVAPETAFVVGNTIVDAVEMMIPLLEMPSNTSGATILPGDSPQSTLLISDRFVVVTVHRRENFGAPLVRVLDAVKKIALSSPETKILVMLHPNPNVAQPVKQELGHLRNVILSNPLPYLDFTRILKFTQFVITDSGGIQEECLSFGKPVLVLREKTERPEGVDLGIAQLVGSNTGVIFSRALELLKAEVKESVAVSPYGDGRASERIVSVTRDFLDG